MAGSTIFSKLDIYVGYWQIELVESVQEKTLFCCKFESFCFEVTLFGLTHSPSTFQSIVESLFEALDYVQVYTDDVFVGSKSIEEHIHYFIVVCDHIKGNGQKKERKKFVIASLNVEFLGYSI